VATVGQNTELGKRNNACSRQFHLLSENTLIRFQLRWKSGYSRQDMENDVSTVLWPDRRTKVLESKLRHESAEGLSLRLLLWLNVKLQVSPCATAKRVPLEAHEPCPLHPATPPTPALVTPPSLSHLNNWVWQQFKRLPAFVCTQPAKSSTFYFISPRTCLASRKSWGNCKWKWPCQWASTMCCPNHKGIQANN